MTIGFAVQLLRGGVLQTLLIAAPLLLIGMVVGLIISIFQATTSIQEQTLSFVPKIAAILGALILLGPWIMASMVQFTVRLFARIPELGG
ncbi:MAG: EscS/YscS/HrcS family type III secretion system export apparatus protein [Spirochaetes bacterium RBG_16_67_19]|jgi:flagellar biosynthetic protein FliQ|nr:MAG: EscS/YscS/HrcS family type III secretion system export apparatus protein [Spirochaetes bacterium GWB1_66_5]OHD71843.1 MAG: EscS/YscS/HrcS family type III secretion system export apparatus protein [Spirochaetes bacterium RBG_16_67_19]